MNSCTRFRYVMAAIICVCLLAIAPLQMTLASQQQAPTSERIPADFYRLPGPQAVQPMPSAIMDSNPQAVRMSFYDPPLEYGEVTLDGTAYNTIQLSGEAATLDPGAPDIPRVVRLVMVNNTGNVELSITNQSYSLQTGFLPAPRQSMEGDDDAPAGGVIAPKQEIYSDDAWYPPVIAEISEPATLRDVRFVVLTIYPVQVNPVTNEMRVYDDIDVEISNAGGIGSNEITFTPTSISPDFKQLYSTFENFHGSSLDELPVLPGKYLAICANDATVIAQVQKLVNWKKRRGLDASYVTTATTGTSYSSIRSYISSQYIASGGTLESVCLIGDPAASGAYFLDTYPGQYDNYYGTMGGGNPDAVPDISVGRLSATSSSALAAVVNKTVGYESTPDVTDPGWFTRAWCIANTNYIPSNPSTKEYTRQIMLQHGASAVYWSVYSGHTSESDIDSRLTTGISVLNHRMSWIGELSSSDLDQLPTNSKLPFVMVITCGTGSFDGSVATSEYWLFPAGQSASTPKGAIGCVGMHGTGTHVPYNNIVDAGTMEGLYVLDIKQQGVALINGKLELYRNYWSAGGSYQTQVQNFCYWANLMGDPAVPVWRKTPLAPTVSIPSSINLGTNNVSLTVSYAGSGDPAENTFVCLWKGNETYSRGYTDAAGQINLPCSTATTGYMQITVTKDDIYSFLDSINVVTSTASLAHYSTFVDDDNAGGTSGDNNHVLNPGETIDLRIALRNAGTSVTVTGISGSLTTSSPGIQITQASSTYPNLAPGANANPNTAYRIHVNSVFNNEPSTFFLNLTSSVGAQVVRVDLTPSAGDVTYVSNQFFGPGGNLDPGEVGDLAITFENSGDRTLTSATGILRTLDSFITLVDSTGSFGNVAPAANGTNTGSPFNISISYGTYNGHRAHMQLVISDANGFRDSTDFYLTIGVQSSTSPTGPDAHGYYAYDNTESQPPNSGSTYEWVEIAPSQGGSGTSMNFNDQSEDGDQSTSILLPAGFQFMFYGETFDRITICTNGWLAFGSYNMDDFRNYRMGSPIGPPNQVAAYWDDLKAWGTNNNVYYWHNSDEHYFVVEWRALTLWTSVSEFFEIILYDPAYYPSATGDGKIKVQYQQVTLSPNADNSGTDNLYASVGIQNADHGIGVDYYYWNQYSAGSASLVGGRSIMYSTDGTGQLNPSISVSQPNGGENWYIGQQYNILWNSTSIDGPVSISLNRTFPSLNWETLTASTNNDGIMQWTVTGSQSTSHARIRVTSVQDTMLRDTSDADFSITVPSATLLAPNGGEEIATGSELLIDWVSDGLGAVRVEINRSFPSLNWEVIDSSADFSFFWTAIGPPTANARIRVKGINTPTIGDTCDGDFTIDIPPQITHDKHADQAPGAALFVAKILDDGAGVVTRLLYRLVGAGDFDSLTFVATGNPDEYSTTIPNVDTGTYEYFIRATDPQFYSTTYPATGTLKFDVASLCDSWISYDDGTSENYNWVSGPDFQWAVKFDPGNYPFTLCAGRFAVCPVCPSDRHDPIVFRVLAADGPSGLPGTVLFSDTTGSPGNVIGGLPSGAAWADVVTRVGGVPLSLNGPFYLSVQNPEPRTHPVAFATDTLGLRSHQSFIYDACDGTWYSEDSGLERNRPGNRMIRASGFNLAAVDITITRVDSAGVISSQLRWISNGAPYYHVFSALTASGPFATLEATVPGQSFGDPVTYTDTGAINTTLKKFYYVTATDTP